MILSHTIDVVFFQNTIPYARIRTMSSEVKVAVKRFSSTVKTIKDVESSSLPISCCRTIVRQFKTINCPIRISHCGCIQRRNECGYGCTQP